MLYDTGKQAVLIFGDINMDILYEDKNILICCKKPGVMSQHTTDCNGLADEVMKYCGYAGLVNRLDFNVGGAIIFGKNKYAAAKLSALVSENKTVKKYLAVVHGCPEQESGVLEDLLFKDSTKNKSYVVKRLRKGVKKASLEYKTVAKCDVNGEMISLLEIKLHTGRTHQIRVQFASRKMPLLGDGKYGSRDNISSLGLWSYQTEFDSPFDGKNIKVISIPDAGVHPWDLFYENLC